MNWSLVRYRKSDDREQLLHSHELGLEALEHTEHEINKRQLNAKFAYYWGMLTACHGYILCASKANANDLSSERAGAASRAATNLDKHKIWYSHCCLRPLLISVSLATRIAAVTGNHVLTARSPVGMKSDKVTAFPVAALCCAAIPIATAFQPSSSETSGRSRSPRTSSRNP